MRGNGIGMHRGRSLVACGGEEAGGPFLALTSRVSLGWEASSFGAYACRYGRRVKMEKVISAGNPWAGGPP